MVLFRSLSADSLCGESKQRTCHLILTTLLAIRSSRLPPWDLVGLMLGNRCNLLELIQAAAQLEAEEARAATAASASASSATAWINELLPDEDIPMVGKQKLQTLQLDHCDPKSHCLVACLAPGSSGLHSIGLVCLVIGPLSCPNLSPTMH